MYSFYNVFSPKRWWFIGKVAMPNVSHCTRPLFEASESPVDKMTKQEEKEDIQCR